jgi:hypothetical protein
VSADREVVTHSVDGVGAQRNVGVLEYDFDVLRRLLRLPEDVRIEDVREAPDTSGRVQLRIASPQMPRVYPGQIITRFRPLYRTDLLTGAIDFEGWGNR